MLAAAAEDPLATRCQANLDRALVELADSLAQLASGGGRPEPVRRGAAVLGDALARRPADAGDPDPLVWLAYYRLGHPLAGADTFPFPWAHDPARLTTIAARCSPAGEVVAWGDPSLYTPQEWRLILELLQEGGDFVEDLAPPNPTGMRALRHGADAVRALVRRLPAGLGPRIDRLLALTILATPGPLARRNGRSFGGATAFFLRGASVIHASPALPLPGVLERLVHEAAHAELFAIAQDEPLCHNPDQERHPVRIRPDPRPMNGILHSLHVTGRVCATLDAVLEDGLHDHPDRRLLLEDVRQLRLQQAALGRSSLEAVRRFGRLTPTGQAVCEAAAEALR